MANILVVDPRAPPPERRPLPAAIRLIPRRPNVFIYASGGAVVASGPRGETMRTFILTLCSPPPCSVGARAARGRNARTDDDANAARKSLKKATKCNDKRLRSGPTATCTVDPPPACAGSLTTDAVALAYGPNNPPGRRRQGAVGPAPLPEADRQGGGRLREEAGLHHEGPDAGRRRAAGAQVARQGGRRSASSRWPPTRSRGVVLPAVGPQCAAAIPAGRRHRRRRGRCATACSR